MEQPRVVGAVVTDRDTATARGFVAAMVEIDVLDIEDETTVALVALLTAIRVEERRAIVAFLRKTATDVTRQHTLDWLTVLATRIERGEHR